MIQSNETNVQVYIQQNLDDPYQSEERTNNGEVKLCVCGEKFLGELILQKYRLSELCLLSSA